MIHLQRNIIVKFLGLILFVGVYFIVFFYPLQTVLKYFSLTNDLLFQSIAYILVLFPFVGMIFFNSKKRFFYILSRISMMYIGISFILLFLISLTEFIGFFFVIPPFFLAIVVLFFLIALVSYGIVNANLLVIKKLDLHSEKILKQYRVVHLTDIHIGSRSSKFLERIVAKTNSLDPDVVCITGDLVDVSGVSSQLAPLKKLNSPVFFVTGNHERYVDCENIVSTLKSIGITVLSSKNSSKVFQELQFLGIEDFELRADSLSAISKLKIDNKRYSIFLHHKPNVFEEISKKRIDLMLSGHTHKGQIFPFNFFVRLQFKYGYGLFKRDNSLLYVSSGTGTWGPILRVGSKNQIVVFTVSPKQ
jgi:hypothetical protein